MSSSDNTKLWGGRFTGSVDPVMMQYNESLTFDRVFYSQDIRGSIAYARANTHTGILTQHEFSEIERGLKQVQKEWENNTFEVRPEVDEDIHTANERRLGEVIGKEIAGKLHTGRSRNDQVATDMRLWLRDHLDKLEGYLVDFLRVIAARAEKEIEAVMPGYTHLQRAQPIRWSHWMLMYGSSLMPQKKNPDSLELLRGKSGRVFGQMAGLMMSVKGIPSTYNKDLQESVEPMLDHVKTVGDSLQIATGVLSTLAIRPENMLKALTPDMLATDLADYLVRKGVPFRETHHISGQVVALAEKVGKPMDKLSLEELQGVDKRFEKNVMEVFDYQKSVEMRSAKGGTSKSAVMEQIEAVKTALSGGR
ncbi:argininosuccinate lyase [Rachicladosporium monterosium]|uniref:Arginosuccinase n=1 Tax=Rachicladosporium monterosium TaxID=1507873 RepID=A0ABR0L7T2_9PEZI|nr:argininosuccinate lyase [Rachicladosporium monterosium]